ncbi:hypothetical protein [Pedobacter borealis]|uniref:hypothetical protein n=1 Tax=Pedobacter borealis TaxID=475254 RepID=UPI001428C0D4|nr:hypothetical protein [Pedobacter borealis]
MEINKQIASIYAISNGQFIFDRSLNALNLQENRKEKPILAAALLSNKPTVTLQIFRLHFTNIFSKKNLYPTIQNLFLLFVHISARCFRELKKRPAPRPTAIKLNSPNSTHPPPS